MFSSRPAVSMVTHEVVHVPHQTWWNSFSLHVHDDSVLGILFVVRFLLPSDGFEASRRFELLATHQQSGGLMWMCVCLSLLAVAAVVLFVQPGNTELTFEFLGSGLGCPHSHTLC